MAHKKISRIKSTFKKYDTKKKKMPTLIKPMLATLTKDYFFDSDWLYERKFDGERCIAFKSGKAAHLKSRNNISLNSSYPEIQTAIAKISGVKNAIFDGEVVAFKGNLTDFSKLQGRMHVKDVSSSKASAVKVYYYIFDIIYLNGYDLTKLPLIERKRILRSLFTFTSPIRFSAYKFKSSKAEYHAACKKGWEGLMVKDSQSHYIFKRSRSWLKFKCVAEQELVIGGYTDPQHSRVGFGAILVGYYTHGKLHYAGKVGTGFDTITLKELKGAFDKIASKKCPFTNYDGKKTGVHWIKPVLVCEIGFEEWTKDNKLRHPRYLGLRRDKSAKKVVQERAK